MRHISSRTHPEIKKIITLHTHSGRTHSGLFIAQGIRTCQQLLESGMQLHTCYLTDLAMRDSLSPLHDNSICVVTPSVMEKISTTVTPSGILCVFHMPCATSYTTIDNSLILIDIRDPGNMGTLIRSAAAFGIKKILMINCVDIWNPKVVQAAAGAHALLNFFKTTFHDVYHKKHDIYLYALVAHGGAPLSLCSRLSDKSAFVIGGEAHGIADTIRAQCDQSFTLAMAPGIESLNAAVAGSIALYYSFTFSDKNARDKKGS